MDVNFPKDGRQTVRYSSAKYEALQVAGWTIQKLLDSAMDEQYDRLKKAQEVSMDNSILDYLKEKFSNTGNNAVFVTKPYFAPTLREAMERNFLEGAPSENSFRLDLPHGSLKIQLSPLQLGDKVFFRGNIANIVWMDRDQCEATDDLDKRKMYRGELIEFYKL